MHFRFRMLIDTKEYYCMRDRLPPMPISLGSRDLFKFEEMSVNISKTVQDRDSCSRRLIGNRIWPIEWHHYW